MLLRSLEIQGFKTFPDKTKLEFDKGITAVVGPNGSGKSNISDAIRWVLGEQSAKALRCSKMEDVVFNGTDNRKKLGYAEVTLTIDNSDRALPFDGNTVSVTRRYYRSGDSDYLINKASVRLKDIHELFMDTGLGRDGYSMISQGKIDSIVASKSEDRREIFEEASGISRFRYRKTEAERKLSQTEENLLRLRDILSELEERVGPLGRQAEKAKAYLEYAKEKEGLEIAIWLNTIEKSSAQLREQEDKIAVAVSQHEAAEKALSDIKTETEDIYNERGVYASKMDEIRRVNGEIEGEIAEIRAKISVEENNIKHTLDTIKRLEDEIEKLDGEKELGRLETQRRRERLEQLKKEHESEKESFNETTIELSGIIENDGKSSELLNKYNSGLASLNVELANARATLTAGRESAEELTKRLDATKEALSSKKADLEKLKGERAELAEALSETQKEVTALTNAISGCTMLLSNCRKKRDAIKEEGEGLSLKIKDKTNRKQYLEELERNLDGFNQSVKLLVKESRNGGLKGIHGPVSRVITVPSEYAVAVETALGGALQNIVTDTEDDAKRAIAFLKRRDGGRATFLPISTIKGRELDEKGLESCEGVVGIASRLCTCDSQYEGILRSLLGRTCIAEDIDCAVNIARRYGYHFRIVTLDGQIVNAGGSLTGGSLGKKAGLLSRVGEIERYSEELKTLETKINEKRAEYTKAQADCGSAEARLKEKQALLDSANEDRLRAEAAASSNEGQIRLFEETVAQLESDESTAQARIKEIDEKCREAEKTAWRLEGEIAKAQKDADGISDKIAKQTEKREKLTKKLSEIRLRMLALSKDIESAEAEIKAAQLSESEQAEKRARMLGQIEDEKKAKLDIERIIGKYNGEKAEKRGLIAQNNEKLTELSSQRAQLDKRDTQLRNLEREKMSEKETIAREMSRLEERRDNLSKQYDDIIKKLWDEYELTPKTAQQSAAEITTLTAAQKRLSELKSKIKSLGSVNVAAIDEYKEVSERYEFLKAQVGDVERSKKEITSLIGDLTKQMKEIFVERFALINKNFGETFKELFGGGSASLSLTNEEDILGSGIDINCHPPGKIVAHLESLSGGERALVAIALYFAIMKVSPAPFCVMDEIEAALDEVNVERFARYMRSINNATQFILITHRRGTMEEADVLYGVTMQDEGVSKLLELHSTEVAAGFTRLK